MKQLKTKIILFCAGLILSAVLIEAGLYCVGYIHYKKSQQDIRTKKDFGPDTKVILCVGDSFTIGIGAPRGLDYPSQLEKIGHDKGYDIAVINRGCSGQNTRMLLKDLEATLIAVRPDIVTVLSGGANEWNSSGITSLTTKGKLHNFLRNIRIVKLFRLLWMNLHNNFKSPSIELIEDTYILEQYPLWENPSGFDWAVEILKVDASSTDKDFFKKLNQYCKQGDFEKARQFINQADKIDFSQLSQKYREFFTYLGNNRFDLASTVILESFDNQAPWKIPELFVFSFFNNEIQNEAIVDFIIENIRKYPEHRSSYNMALQFMLGYKGKNSRQVKQKVAKAIAQSSDYGKIFMELANKQDGLQWVLDWTKQDLRKIIKLCQKYGADVLVQNYPHFGDEETTLLFKSAAAETKAMFLNQAQSFQQIPEQEKELYFALDGHCNARGYKRMAENIFTKLSDAELISKTNT